MNVFFIVGNKALTPSLDSGTILAGVTRDSAIAVLRDMGLQVEEREINIDELADAYRAGELREIFGTGTAATISLIRELCYRDLVMQFDVTSWKVAPELKSRLDAIRNGSAANEKGWMFRV
jgi:branched-chain amino acid aminotransferase